MAERSAHGLWSVLMGGGYRLNSRDFADLAAHSLDARVVRTLRSLEDAHFRSREEFQRELQRVLGDASSPSETQLIAAHAKRVSWRKLRQYLLSIFESFFGASRLAPRLGVALLLRPVGFTLWFRGRALVLRLWSGLRGVPFVRGATNANEQGYKHNLRQLLGFLPGHRNRTERLINALRTIQEVNAPHARTLCVGPRNEAEVLLLRLYGFRRRHIEAIDLFTYSPLIKVMDMNRLEYPDDYFDVYYSSAVIKYSPDIRQTVREAIRVTRDGGFVAFGFMFGTVTDLAPRDAQLAGGVRELLAFFGDHVEHVYWNEEYEYAPGDIRATTIFRLKKRSGDPARSFSLQ